MWIVSNHTEVNGNAPGWLIHRSPLAMPVQNRPHPPEDKILTQAASNFGVGAGNLAAYWIVSDSEAQTIAEAAGVDVSFDGTEISSVSATVPPSEVWLHVSIAGGDGEDIPGANLDDSNPLEISMVLRQTQDPASAVIQVNRSYRITVRDTDGVIYDVRRVVLVDGEVGPVDYSGNSHAAVCEVLESDFEPVTVGATTYKVRLAQPVKFKFYQNLT